ncbi:MAG: hypothetical protein IPI65_01070 [Bacteroidetes bacterium]|nr:hypothetical protein [Bacteroidota bacterium]
MRLFGDDTDITDGIDSNVWKAIDKSININNAETFRVLKSFVRHVLQTSVRYQSLNHFRKYIFFFSYFYSVSYKKAKQKPSLTDLHLFCSEQAAIHLKEVIWFDIAFAGRRSKEIEERKIINRFYYSAFEGFSRLLYYIVQNGDIAQFKFAMDEYEQISDVGYGNYFDLKWEIKNLERENADGSKDEIIKTKKEEYKIVKSFDDYKRHVLLGIKYWIYYLYRVNKIKEDVATEFLKHLNIPYADSEDLVNDILFFRGNASNFYMGWSEWDFMERHSGKVYSPPQPYDWMTFGFMADQIREKKVFFNLNELDAEEISQAKFLFDELKRTAEYFEKNFAKWKKLLNKNGIEDLQSNSKDILKDFELVKRKSINDKDRAVAIAPLHQPFITDFKNIIGKAWKSQARMHRMFKQFGNSEDVTGQEVELKRIGQRTVFEKAKMMFTKENNQHMYGIDQIGGQTGRWEDNYFFSTILQGEFNKVNGTNALQILDAGLKELEKKSFQPDLILLAPEYGYRDKDLLDSKRFVSKLNEPQPDNDLAFFLIGTFDGIPIYSSFSDFLKSRILICNFQQAFKMLYKTNENWFENELTVEVFQVEDAEAQRKLSENRTKWTTTEDGTVLTDAEALLLIKTSVIIDIWTTIEFRVLNKDAFVVGNIKSDVATELLT